DCSTDAHCHIQLRADLTAGLADLVRVGTPAVVGHRTRRADCCVAECVGKLLDELEVLRRLETASPRDDDRGLAEIGTAFRTLLHLGDGDDRTARGSRGDALDARRL